MKPFLPFRQEDEKTLLIKIHPVIRFILPFILVIPILIIDNLYLIYTLIIINFIFILIFRLKFFRILSRIKSIIPFILLIVIFIPLYYGTTIIFQINLIIKIKIYKEGLLLAILLFFRIFCAIFVFMTFFSSLTYSEFIDALTKLRLPSLFVGSLIIMLHYIPIIADSNRTIIEAQELRGKKIINYWQKLKTHAYIMAKSIVINMERSEILYESLKMRGFTGHITHVGKKVHLLDIIILILFFFLMIFLGFIINLEQIYKGVAGIFLQ
ncbi:MAG: energy-coupling factor transporter transmembrane component T family protein [Promethearchaeota archaeon]